MRITASTPVIDRLADKVEITDTCWLWQGTTVTGYGQLKVMPGRVAYAHRASYELLVGPVPNGMELDHLCRVRNCINPDHLEVVTHQVNMDRSENFLSNRTHCSQGHEYTEANTAMSNGRRVCRTCRNANERRRRVARRQSAEATA